MRALALAGVVKHVFDGHQVVKIHGVRIFTKSLDQVRVEKNFVALSAVLPTRHNRVVKGDHARSPFTRQWA